MIRSTRRAFTLVELLVVIAIIGILLAILLPAVQATRVAARRVTCASRVSQLIIAAQNYESNHGTYPPGSINDTGPVLNEPVGNDQNWIIQLLPYLEEQKTYRHIDRSVSVYDPKNAPVRELTLKVLQCPSESSDARGGSSYAAVYSSSEVPIDVDNDGVFFLNSAIRYDQVTDGAGATLFIGEKVIDVDRPGDDLGWMSGTRATLRNTGIPLNVTGRKRAGGEAVEADEPPPPGLPVGGFASFHPGGANFAFGDGRVEFLDENITLDVYRRLGSRADGKLMDGDAY